MLHLKYIQKTYPSGGPFVYVNEVNIPKGEIVGILGANGSGKTTLLKAIMGLGSLQSGTIEIDGKPLKSQYDRVAFITEEGSYAPEMTPERYGEFLADYYTRFQLAHYRKLLNFYEIPDDRAIWTLSKGQKLKVEISAGFSKQADYLLLDEPFVGKDVFSRQDLLRLMIGGMKGDETILIATHWLDGIEHVIDRAIVLHQGLVKADTYIDELREQGKTIEELLADVAGYNPLKMKKVLLGE